MKQQEQLAMSFELRKDIAGWYIHFETFGQQVDGSARYDTIQEARIAAELIVHHVTADLNLNITRRTYE